MLFRGGLRSLGYKVTSLQARVVRGLEIDAPRLMLHMVLRIDLPEGQFLADVGFGNLAPTAPLKLSPLIEQATPHEVMRFIAIAMSSRCNRSSAKVGSIFIASFFFRGLMLNTRSVIGSPALIRRVRI
jgi:arylamine N-acetyltransferase